MGNETSTMAPNNKSSNQVMEDLQKQIVTLKEEDDQCTKNEKNQKKENANDGKS